MLKKLKENKKGFTLVELIVVLVILAILAALLVPALTGYIDKAKRKSIVAETRQVVMAAQTLVDEKYGTVDAGADTIKIEDGTKPATATITITKNEIATLAEVGGTIGDSEVEKGVVKKIVYTSKGKTCTYTKGATAGSDGAYDVAE
ncbi:prepilin-type N-terminal cleavage/methylation domain-containing protein [Anaerosacchariphilus sp. NSJ-68]|uniref:Prepilin-type N-terminal cleavage/methylation domain-containing protein n=2 Tax=Lachnospiraceae TaxID=186803 RepID=A0A923RKW4_9FIRM|nr:MULTISPECIES: prepilin-type N-terminal cleavage/methylation domain-containing protein [Lachnospiraceae]MBC5658612.1 prepilin-type N-terminal cleavage/methylation domain-containing protein [Anaerosacchariphilus hominis]MBC5698179.1 prepilin-type N-terminal cleavage/methylation domain-containing protein [Roseburia difficilis]